MRKTILGIILFLGLALWASAQEATTCPSPGNGTTFIEKTVNTPATLCWDFPTGTTTLLYFRIRRSQTPAGNWEIVANRVSTTARAYTLTESTPTLRYYVVTAFHQIPKPDNTYDQVELSSSSVLVRWKGP